MRDRFSLVCHDPEIALRTIAEEDAETLRQWKNANRFSFFFQDIITPEQQAQWFHDYLERLNDFMFVVLSQERAIGCLGFRILVDYADIYNVILGIPEMGGKGLMSDAIRLMCSFVITEFLPDVRAKVLRSNAAIKWYRRNGFYERTVNETFVEVKLDPGIFRPCTFEKVD